MPHNAYVMLIACTFIMMAVLVPVSAGAEGYSAGHKAVMARHGTVVVQKSLCQRLSEEYPEAYASLRHEPDDDVLYSAEDELNMPSAYVEGTEPLEVDITQIRIPVKVPLQDYVSNPSAYNLNMQELFVEVGTLSFDESGRLLMDGKPLRKDIAELVEACRIAEADLTEESAPAEADNAEDAEQPPAE